MGNIDKKSDLDSKLRIGKYKKREYSLFIKLLSLLLFTFVILINIRSINASCLTDFCGTGTCGGDPVPYACFGSWGGACEEIEPVVCPDCCYDSYWSCGACSPPCDYSPACAYTNGQACGNCGTYGPDCSTACDGGCTDCTCTGDKTDTGGTCTTGSSCCSGLCIEGYCRSACSNTYDGDRCSDNSYAYTNAASGVCAKNNANAWSCDKDEVAYNSSDYISDCYYIRTGPPLSVKTCDSDVSPDFSANGICTWESGSASTSTVNCDSSSTCFNNSYYISSCSLCYSSGSTFFNCSSSGGPSYSPDGICVAGGSCDINEVCFNSTHYRDDCSSCYSSGSTVYQCDFSGGYLFLPDGICVAGGVCDNSGHACFDDSAYQSSCSACSYDYDLDPQADSCDSDISNAAYSATGICTYSNSCSDAGSIVSVNSSNNNYFVLGCSNATGDLCDSSITTSWSQDGLCVSGSYCDNSQIANHSNKYYGNCSGHGGYQCDFSASAGSFSQDGLCYDNSGLIENSSFRCQTSGFVFYNGSYYLNSSSVSTPDYSYSSDPNGKSCDSSLSNGNYLATGMINSSRLCMPAGSLARYDVSDNYYFKAGCDDSADPCGTVSSSLASPWTQSGICCSNSCTGSPSSNCCDDSDCPSGYACSSSSCVFLGNISIKNLGITGIELTNQEFTSQRSVMLILAYNSTNAISCRYINYDSLSVSPPDSNSNWTNWESCISNRIWELSPSSGLKAVYYQINYSSRTVLFNDSIYYNYTGSGLDITPPSIPSIYHDSFSNNTNSVSVSWYAYDYESQIFGIPLIYNYSLFINNASKTILDSVLTTSTSAISNISRFNLPHNSQLIANVTVFNSAYLSSSNLSSGLIIDLVKPYLISLNGTVVNLSNPNSNFRISGPSTENSWTLANSVFLSWLGYDDLSISVAAYSYSLSKDPASSPDNIPEGNIYNLQSETSKSFSSLSPGKYYFKIKTKDIAGNWGNISSLNFSIDSSPPSSPSIISENKSDNSASYLWSPSYDSESDISLYRIVLRDYSGNIIKDANLSGYYHNNYTFTGLSSNDFNATVYAMNGVGLWANSNQVLSYADFTPPVILMATPNVTSISLSPILKIWTDEIAICYYNNSIFSFTNSSYHESKVANLLDNSPFSYLISCSDLAGNSISYTLSFLTASSKTPQIISSLPVINAYQNTLTTFPVFINDSDSSTKLAGLSKNLFSFLINNKETEFYLVDIGHGKYNLSFITPDIPGTYTLRIIIDPFDLNLTMIVNQLSFSAQYNAETEHTALTPKNTPHITYNTNDYKKIGFASDADTSNIGISSNTDYLNISGISLEDNLFIINTKIDANIESKERYLNDQLLLSLTTPSFGYKTDEKIIVRFIISPEDFNILSEAGDDLQPGKYNYILQNAKSKSGYREVIIKKEEK